MCLEVRAVPLVDKKVSAERLSRVSGLHVKKIKGTFRFSVDGGCSCSLMAEHADWNNPIWALEPQYLDGLASALKLLGDEAGGFTFEAIWLGESDLPETQKKIRLSDLLQEVRSNRVRNKHTYIVGTWPEGSKQREGWPAK